MQKPGNSLRLTSARECQIQSACFHLKKLGLQSSYLWGSRLIRSGLRTSRSAASAGVSWRATASCRMRSASWTGAVWSNEGCSVTSSNAVSMETLFCVLSLISAAAWYTADGATCFSAAPCGGARDSEQQLYLTYGGLGLLLPCKFVLFVLAQLLVSAKGATLLGVPG